MVKHALGNCASAAEQVSRRTASKKFCMSDAEEAFREGLSSAHGSEVLMCWFHVTQAMRKWLLAHTNLRMELRAPFWLLKVKPDIDCLHRSLNPAEFQAKSKAIMNEWGRNGVCAITYHIDGNQQPRTFTSYFKPQWIDQHNEWFAGKSLDRPCLSTNNATERRVGLTRKHAAAAPCGAKALAQWMLAEVEHLSHDSWDAGAQRPIKTELWNRAYELKKLIGTNKVRKVLRNGETFFVCLERDGSDVQARPVISKEEAMRLITIRCQLRAGSDVTYADIEFHRRGRVFGVFSGRPDCTCPAFPDYRRCLHTLGHGLFTGQVKAPHCLDDMPLLKGKRGPGRSLQVGGRYYKPEDEESASSESDEDAVSKEQAAEINAFLREASRRPMQRPSDATAKKPAAHAAGLASTASTQAQQLHSPARKRASAVASTASAGAPSPSKRMRQNRKGPETIIISVTTTWNAGFPSDLQLVKGCTIADAVQAIANMVEADIDRIKVTDRNVRVAAPKKGWTAGAEWMQDDGTELHENHEVLVLPKLRGG